MANIELNLSWKIDLSTDEFRLVLKALGGRLKPEDIELARQFGDKLTKYRANSIKAQTEVANRILSQVNEIEQPMTMDDQSMMAP